MRASSGREGRSDLARLFGPRSIAMIGPSRRSALTAGIARRLKTDGFAGPVWMVTPNHREIFGYPCFASLREVPGIPDLVVVAVKAQSAADALVDAADCGAKAAVVIGTGFGDAGEQGQQRSLRLAAVAREKGIVLCGPGSFGFSVPATGVSPFGEGPSERMPAGSVAVVAQSGGFANLLSLAAIERGYGFSYLVASGSEIAVDASDYLAHVVEDERTSMLVAVLEEIRDVSAFTAVLGRADELGKPVVVLPLGRSELGRRVTSAHSGALSSSADVQEAYLRSAGAIVVTTLDDLVETIVLLNGWRRLPTSARPLVVSISGGDCGLVADLASDAKVEIAALSPATQARLQALLPESTLVRNPVDLGTRPLVEPGLETRVIEAAAADDAVNMVLYRLAGDPKDFVNVATACALLEKPFAVFTRVALPLHPAVVAVARDRNVPVMQGIDRALAAVKRVTEQAARGRGPRTTAMSDSVRSRVASMLARPRRSDIDALALLREAGIDTVESRPASSPAEAAAAARELGFPVALKVDSPDIAHKSDVGGVRLRIADQASLLRAFDEVVADARRAKPDAEIRGTIVQPMLDPVLELILGAVCDPRFGAAVVVGLGGLLAEVLRRREIVVPPLSREEAAATITRLLAPDAKATPDWRGLRVDAAAAALASFSELASIAAPDIVAIDINPLAVFRDGRGAVALDCLIQTRDRAARGLGG